MNQEDSVSPEAQRHHDSDEHAEMVAAEVIKRYIEALKGRAWTTKVDGREVPLLPVDVAQLRHALTPESDRGCALLAAAFLDCRLEELLTAFFVDDATVVDGLVGSNGPLATFSSRINMGYCLGLFGKEVRRDLDLVRRIRNDFAHLAVNVSFESQGISQRCQELALAAPWATDARRRFTSAVMGLTAIIDVGKLSVERRSPPSPIDFAVRREGIKADEQAIRRLVAKAFQSDEGDCERVVMPEDGEV